MPKAQTAYKKKGAGSFIRNFISVGITGIVFGLGGLILGFSMIKGIDGLAGGLLGLIAGYLLGVIIGIAWVNKISHYYGSLLFGVIGAIIAALAAISLEEPLNLDLDPVMLFGAFFISVPLLGVIGFYLKNQPEESV